MSRINDGLTDELSWAAFDGPLVVVVVANQILFFHGGVLNAELPETNCVSLVGCWSGV